MIQLNVLGEIIRSTWLRLPEFFPLRHDEWVIMPNHLQAIIWILDSSTGEASAIPDSSDSHILIADASPQGEPIGTQPGSIGAIIQNFKSISTRKINQWMRDSRTDETSSIPGYENLKSQSGSASPQQIWQRNYYEHIVRNDLEFGRIQQYIDRNPSQWVTDQENPNKIG
jgi:REP element-mobilizing transposase RayT